MTASRSAPGPAAGFQWQFQHALLAVLRADSDDAAVDIEDLDDVDLSDASGVISSEQLKHSLKPGGLGDMSKPLWSALQVWMDLQAAGQLASIQQLTLVTTLTVNDAPALTSIIDGRFDDAVTGLLEAARNSTSDDTAAARETFLALSDEQRDQLVSKIRVEDARPGVGEFMAELRSALRVALPAEGADEFLRQIVGWWDERAVDLLLRRRPPITKGEVLDEIQRFRDGFTARTLPDADVGGELTDLAKRGYLDAAFVQQLTLLDMSSDTLHAAILDYHRAFTQRSRWLQDQILPPGELRTWERRLVDEWSQAYLAMREELKDGVSEEEMRMAGRALLRERQQRSGSENIRGSSDWFLLRGTLHGLADVGRVGWHPEFQERLASVLQEAADDLDARFGERP